MLYNIGYTNDAVIYCHSTVITKVMMFYNTEWWYDHGMVVNYPGKKFYNILTRLKYCQRMVFIECLNEVVELECVGEDWE